MPTRSLPLGASSARAAGVAGWLMAEVTVRRKRAVHASALRIIYVSIPFETALCWSAGDYPNMAAEKGGWDATILEVGGAGRRFHARRHERCARAIRLSLAAGAGHRRLSGGRQRGRDGAPARRRGLGAARPAVRRRQSRRNVRDDRIRRGRRRAAGRLHAWRRPDYADLGGAA